MIKRAPSRRKAERASAKNFWLLLSRYFPAGGIIRPPGEGILWKESNYLASSAKNFSM